LVTGFQANSAEGLQEWLNRAIEWKTPFEDFGVLGPSEKLFVLQIALENYSSLADLLRRFPLPDMKFHSENEKKISDKKKFKEFFSL
jgi:hypothetical protein